MKKAAHWISIGLHPLFMPLITIWLALRIDPHLGYFLSGQSLAITLVMVGVLTIAFPLTSTLLLLRAGLVDDLRMPDRRQRIAPFAITLMYYAMAYYLLRRSALHHGLLPLFTGAMLALAITTLVSLRWRISAHMVGIGGLLGAIAALAAIHRLPVLPLLGLLIVVAGALGSARIVEGHHSHAQVFSGAGLGFLCTYMSISGGWAL